MNHKVTKVHPDDNVLIALSNLEEGEEVNYNGESYLIKSRVPAKHKLVEKDLQPGNGRHLTFQNLRTGHSKVSIGKTERLVPPITGW
jgi:hypothetical protein